MSLTIKERLFVGEYLVDLSATDAAIRAGYSARTAYSIGSRLLKKPEIAAEIEKRMALREKRTEVTADRVLLELAKIGFTDMSDVADWGVKDVAFGFDGDGKRLPPEDIGEAAAVTYAEAPFIRPINQADLTPQAKAAVAEISLGKDGFRIKLHDKGGALAKIGQHLGMFKERHEHSGPDGGPIQLNDTDAAVKIAGLLNAVKARRDSA
jgi:phage terminase small subunit